MYSSKINRKTIALCIFVALWVAGSILLIDRSLQMERACTRALSSSTSTGEARQLVDTLSRHSGSRATELLVRIATARRDFVDDRQDVAIRAIAARSNPEATARIATLLQPFVGLARREAAATAIEGTVCNEECSRLVLHYLERRWAGNGQQDDITSVAVGSDNYQIEAEQSHVTQQLINTLQKNGRATLIVLRDTYGLGSQLPGSFSLYIVDSTDLHQACPLLMISKQRLLDDSKKETLDRLIKKMRCPPEFD